MNESLPPPPPPPDRVPPPPPDNPPQALLPPEPASLGPGTGGAIGMGIGLFIVCLLMAWPTKGASLVIGFIIAFIALFFPGYRYVFVTYLLVMLIVFGSIALLVVIACSGMRNI